MGAFFSNFQLRTRSADQVADAARGVVKKRGYVSTAKNGWVTLFEEAADEQDPEHIQRVAGTLSAELQIPVFAFAVYDSDVLLYWLYENGELMDHYNSRPDYFAEPGEKVDPSVWDSFQGNPNALKPYCVTGTRITALTKVLHREPMAAEEYLDARKRRKKRPYDFEEQRLRALACLLGIDENRACLGYLDVHQGGAGSRKDYRPVKKTAGKRGKKK